MPRLSKTNLPIVLAALLLLPCLGYAQLGDLRLPISLDADSTAYDGRNSMLMFKGLRLSQGNIGIEADEGRASKLDFEDSVWRFSGNVKIDVDNGHIECDAANLQFSDHQLMLAVIDGVPATFELKRPGSEAMTYAEAKNLRYDLVSATIEFSGDATITENGNQISSQTLIYNIAEQRINATGDGDDKVTVIYTPQATDEDETPGDSPVEGVNEAAPEADEAPVDTTDEDGGDDSS